MKFVNNILVMTILLFFIGCSAWPALIPIPPGKTKKEAYIIPLAAASSQRPTPSVQITGPLAAGGTGAVANTGLKFLGTIQLGTIDAAGTNTTSTATWDSSDKTIATVSTSGLVTANASKEGSSKITATISGQSATFTAYVNATGTIPTTSIVAFDGKNFIQLSESISTNSTEEK